MALIEDIRTFNWQCHGIPERCLVVRGRRMEICARCFGCNIGHLGALVLFIIGHLPAWYWGATALGTMFIDWGAQEMFGHMSNNPRRVLTGVIGGLGMGILFWTSVRWAYGQLSHILG